MFRYRFLTHTYLLFLHLGKFPECRSCTSPTTDTPSRGCRTPTGTRDNKIHSRVSVFFANFWIFDSLFILNFGQGLSNFQSKTNNSICTWNFSHSKISSEVKLSSYFFSEVKNVKVAGGGCVDMSSCLHWRHGWQLFMIIYLRQEGYTVAKLGKFYWYLWFLELWGIGI